MKFNVNQMSENKSLCFIVEHSVILKKYKKSWFWMTNCASFFDVLPNMLGQKQIFVFNNLILKTPSVFHSFFHSFFLSLFHSSQIFLNGVT